MGDKEIMFPAEALGQNGSPTLRKKCGKIRLLSADLLCGRQLKLTATQYVGTF